MSEKFPDQFAHNSNESLEDTKKRIIEIATELSGSKEQFAFPGIKPESYEKMKADDDEYPGLTTHIDEIIAKLKDQGMKVVLTRDPRTGIVNTRGVMLMPMNSEDISDGVRTNVLLLDAIQDARLKELLSLINSA